jgi:citrate lyase subunit beta / citryl-CoA lyase
MDRSYLFAPGHNAKLLGRVFDVGADAVMLDLETRTPQPDALARWNGVPPRRFPVAFTRSSHPALVRFRLRSAGM